MFFKRRQLDSQICFFIQSMKKIQPHTDVQLTGRASLESLRGRGRVLDHILKTTLNVQSLMKQTAFIDDYMRNIYIIYRTVKIVGYSFEKQLLQAIFKSHIQFYLYMRCVRLYYMLYMFWTMMYSVNDKSQFNVLSFIWASLMVQLQRICLQRRRCRRHRLGPWVGKIPWKRKWQFTPVFFPEQSHGQRSLVGYSPKGRNESDMVEQLIAHAHVHLFRMVILLIPFSRRGFKSLVFPTQSLLLLTYIFIRYLVLVKGIF